MSKGHKYVEPQRMCCACRTMRGKKELLRLVRSLEGQISLDDTGKKPGRGAYLCLSKECLKKARKARSLERALAAGVPAQLWEELEALVTEAEHGAATETEDS